MKDIMRVKCLLSSDVETLINQQIKKKLIHHLSTYQWLHGATEMVTIFLLITSLNKQKRKDNTN